MRRQSEVVWLVCAASALITLSACTPEAPPPPAAQASPVASAPATPPLSAPARELSLGAPPEQDRPTYPGNVGQAVDHAIYRGLYDAVSPLSDLAAAASPDTSVADQPRGQVLTVYYTGNVQSEVEDCGCKKNPMGGLGRKAALIASSLQTKIEMDRPDGYAVADAGDLFFKSPQQARGSERDLKVARLIADAIVASLNAMPTDAFSPGRLDLVFGLEELGRLRKASRFPWVSANLHRPGQTATLFPPFVVKEVAGRRIAFLGLIDETDPAALRELGVDASDPRAALLAQAKPLRDANVQGVVLLSNLGVTRTEKLLENVKREDIPLVLAVVSGTRRTTFQPVWVSDQEIPMVEAGAQGKHLGRADLHVLGDNLHVASGRTPVGASANQYLNSYRSVHNARTTLAVEAGSDPQRVERLKKSLDLSLQRLHAVEASLPDAPPRKKGEEATSWLRSRVMPLPTSLDEEPRVRAILDGYRKRVEALGGKWGH